jgi:hypothetical protein
VEEDSVNLNRCKINSLFVPEIILLFKASLLMLEHAMKAEEALQNPMIVPGES